MARNVGGGPKRSKYPKKVSTGTTEMANLREQEVQRFDESLPGSFPFGYTSAAPFDDSVSKEWIVNSRMVYFYAMWPCNHNVPVFTHIFSHA